MIEFLAVALITILAVISPGADFAIITKNSYLYGRTTGILTAIGIACGVLVHVAYTLVALAIVMAYIPNFLGIVKYVGAAYLMYIGYATFVQSPIIDTHATAVISKRRAFVYGLLTNALNPKTTLFVISTYTQIVSTTTPTYILVGYGVFMSLAHLLWFVLMAFFFSHQHLRSKMLNQQVMINKVIGSILVMLGGLLIVANI
ncbi:MAG: LysE family transporter [Moraxella sp.]|nr:LysE family transporter [Moraxella sp.]